MSDTITQSNVICQRLESLKQRFEKRFDWPAASEADEMMNTMLRDFVEESLRLTQQYFEQDEPKFAGQTSMSKIDGMEAHYALREYAEAARTLQDLVEQIELEIAEPDNGLTALFTGTVKRDCQDISKAQVMIDNSWTQAMRRLNILSKPPGLRLVSSNPAPGLY